MSKVSWVFPIVLLGAALPLAAQSTQPQSLGDLARQIRQQKDQGQTASKPTRVITNDTLPAPYPGDITVLAATPSNPATPATSEKPATEETKEPKPASHDEKPKTRDEWQSKFRSLRQDLAHAKEVQQLAEDELNLLQIQQTRELDTNVKQDLSDKVQAKQSEVDLNRATTAEAQKKLEELEKDFKESGAPDDWSVTDEPKPAGS